ncbi:MAG TPA: hypothetical protein VLH86_01345 [Patescibacteria group bacterium]|nr:hypothetical protein [Patescibacteria group bacterium]
MDSVENMAGELTGGMNGLPQPEEAARAAAQLEGAAQGVLSAGDESSALGEVAAHLAAGSEAAQRAAGALAAGKEHLTSYLSGIGVGGGGQEVAVTHEEAVPTAYEDWGFAGELTLFLDSYLRRVMGRGIREPEATNLRMAAGDIREELMAHARDGQGNLVPISELVERLDQYQQALLSEDPAALARMLGSREQATLTVSLIRTITSGLSRVPNREAFWEITDREEDLQRPPAQREAIEVPVPAPVVAPPSVSERRKQLHNRIVELTRDEVMVQVPIPQGTYTLGKRHKHNYATDPWNGLKYSTIGKAATEADTIDDVPIEAVAFTQLDANTGGQGMVKVDYTFNTQLSPVVHSAGAYNQKPSYKEMTGPRMGGSAGFTILLPAKDAEVLRQAARQDRTILRQLMRTFYIDIAGPEAEQWWERGVAPFNHPAGPPYHNFLSNMFMFDGITPGRRTIAEDSDERYKNSFDLIYSLEKIH